MNGRSIAKVQGVPVRPEVRAAQLASRGVMNRLYEIRRSRELTRKEANNAMDELGRIWDGVKLTEEELRPRSESGNKATS